MKKTILIIAATLLVFPSCGPSKEQLESRELAKNDSIAKNAQTTLLKQQEEAQKAADEEQTVAEQRRYLKNQLIELKSKLAGEKANLENVERLKFLRTKEEKAQQITEQTRIIEELEAQIEEIKEQLK